MSSQIRTTTTYYECFLVLSVSIRVGGHQLKMETHLRNQTPILRYRDVTFTSEYLKDSLSTVCSVMGVHNVARVRQGLTILFEVDFSEKKALEKFCKSLSNGTIHKRLKDKFKEKTDQEVELMLKLHLIVPNAQKKSPVSREVTEENYQECVSLLRESALFDFESLNITHDVLSEEQTQQEKFSIDDLGVLLQDLNEMASLWFTVGLLLNISYYKLIIIKRENRDDSLECLREMLVTWLMGTEALPSLLVHALRLAGMSVLAKKMAVKHGVTIADTTVMEPRRIESTTSATLLTTVETQIDSLIYEQDRLIKKREMKKSSKLWLMKQRSSTSGQDLDQINQMIEDVEETVSELSRQIDELEMKIKAQNRHAKQMSAQLEQISEEQHGAYCDEREEKQFKHDQYSQTEPTQEPTPDPHYLTSEDIVHAYDVTLRASQQREQELLEKLNAAQRDSQKKDQKCSKLEDDMYDMQKKMAISRDDYEQQQELLEKLQRKTAQTKLASDVTTQVDLTADVIHEYKTKLTASKKEQQELLRVLEQTRKMAYARDQQISMLESDGQLMLEKFDQLKRRNQQLLEDIKPKCVVEAGVQASYLAIAPDFLHGVEVYRETVLEVVGDKPQKVEWPGYGFFIEIPEGAVPPRVTVSVGVKVILAGQFKFPENRQLISAIYWVSSSIEFIKEVSVNIQHCAVVRSEDQCSQFKFIIAKCSQSQLPYKFREREGLFSSHTQYGAIKLKRFSIVAQTAPEGTDTLCTAFMFYKQRLASPLTVDFHFVVVRDLEPNLQKVQEKYDKWNADCTTLSFCFDNDPSKVIELDQQEQVFDSWKIIPLTPPQIMKDAIKYYQVGRTIIPHCGFQLCLLSDESPQVQRLCHKVDIIGVPFPNSFHIRYPQPEVLQTPIAVTQTPASAVTQTPAAVPQTPAAVPQTPTSAVTQTPAAVLQTPAAVLQTPVAVPQTPATVPQTPAAVPQTPASATQTPAAVPQTPAAVPQTPVAVPQTLRFKTPSTADLMVRVACKIPSKWYQVGIMLYIETSTLDSFKAQTNDQIQLFIEVFKEWKRAETVPYTWGTIITALNTVGEKKTATELKEQAD